jgi:glycerophosphoryl diester phosphodiesterase
MILTLLASLVMAEPILVHGHRGARARMPENTLPAFEYAISVGADVLELDLAVTKDNVLVVSHDPYLQGPMCTGPVKRATIRELTLEQVREWDCGAEVNPQFPRQKAVPGTKMPTLDEVLKLAKGNNVEFNIETKIFAPKPELTPSPEEFAALLVKSIEKHKLVSRCIIQSFDFRTLVAARKLNPKIRLSALLGPGGMDFVKASKEAANAEIVSPHYTIVTPAKVKAAHDAGLEVVPWTANETKDWDALIEAKSDAIISDDPEGLLEHLRKKKLHK